MTLPDLPTITVFTMLYIGAIEGEGCWLGPKHVYSMSDEQARHVAENERLTYQRNGWKSRYVSIGQRWYADTTRESIRDDTLRKGFVDRGAAIAKQDVTTTSSEPRYALRRTFAALFDPQLTGDALDAAIDDWSGIHLSKPVLARLNLVRHGAATSKERVSVTLPNGTIRQLTPGRSASITKAVVEQFAPAFLHEPAVVLISDGGVKVVVEDAALVVALGLQLRPDRLLPDVILFDLRDGKELLVFVEVVSTDGPVTEARRESLLLLGTDAGFPPDKVAFVTAYQDRDHQAFKKTVGALAWNSLIWFASEPDHIIMLRERPILTTGRIFDLLQ